MSRTSSPLNNIKIASPCSANWDSMYGNERKRYCGDCKLNVYNISGMTMKEAEGLLEQSEGRLCVRYFRRADGTILTKDCPVGLAKVRQKAARWATATFSLIVGLFSGLFVMSYLSKDKKWAFPINIIKPEREYEMMGAIAESNSNSSVAVEVGQIMGNVAIPITKRNTSK